MSEAPWGSQWRVPTQARTLPSPRVGVGPGQNSTPPPSLPGEHPYLAWLPETLEISEKINSCYLLVLF